MKRLILFATVLTIISCKPGATSDTPQDSAQIDSLVQLGISTFATNPSKSVAIFIEAGQAYEQAKLYDKAGAVFLNVAVLYEENSVHIDSAEIFSARAYENYRMGTDSAQIMSVTKYYGFLKGANGNYVDGRKLINEALAYYRRHNNPEGVAISQYNLSRLAYAERNYGEAIRLLNEAKVHWNAQQNYLRMAMAYMQEIEIALAQEEKQQAYALAGRIDSLIFVGKLPNEFIQRYAKFKERIP